MQQEETKKCPYCSGGIDKKAVKCRYCGEWIEKNPNDEKSKKKSIWNKKVGCFSSCLALIFIFVVIVIITSSLPTGENTVIETNRNTNAQSKQSDESKDTIGFEEVSSYQKSGENTKNIVVSESTTKQELVDLAKKLHKENPTFRYNIFNNKEKIKEYTDWDTNYGKVRDKDGKVKLATDCVNVKYCVGLISQKKDAYPLPEEWVKKHHLADIQKMFKDGDMVWQLVGDISANDPMKGESIVL